MNDATASPRILITRLRYLGDVILSTPLVAAVRAAEPRARIDFLVEEPFAPALAHNPHLDTVHVYPPKATGPEMVGWVRALRSAGYDAVLDLFGNPRSALLTALSGAPLRVGPARGWRSRLFTHRRGRPGGDRSAILHHLDKAVPLLGRRPPSSRPRIWVTDQERRRAASRVGAAPTADTVLLHPGSKWADKAWPAERWPELLRELAAAGRRCLRVVAPPGDESQAAAICRAAGAGQPLPPMPLRELFAWMSEVGLYVGNDGGILHAAVALGRPTLGLFGPTEADIWFPYEAWGPYRVLHPPRPGPLDGIGVDEVLSAALELMELPPEAPEIA